MTIGTLLDAVAFDSGDSSGTYRTKALTWLNLARSEIADAATWRTAIVGDATIDVDGTASDGRYPLKDSSGTTYARVLGEWMYNETDDRPIQYVSVSEIRAVDPDRDITSDPDWWADDGYSDADDAPIVLFHPRPTSSKTISFHGELQLADLTANNENDTTDAYFGEITPWAACWSAGIRYYHDLNNNEDATQIGQQYAMFQRMIRRRKANNALSTVGALSFRNVRDLTGDSPRLGRFDPAHYSNRG